MKHTKGPWIYSINLAKTEIQVSAHHLAYTTFKVPFVEEVREEQLANARLIAAAPELLDGLKIAAKTLSEIAHPLYGTSSWEMERAAEKALILIISAIAKAEGEFK